MKKWIMVMLSFVFLYSMVACYQIPNVGTSEAITSENASSVKCDVFETVDTNSEKNDTQETIFDSILPTPSNEKVYYPTTTAFADTRTRLLYTLNGQIYYYNKIMDASNIFCFNPLCNHKNWEECISLKFVANGTNTNIRYCEYDNRFYAFRGQKLCSFSFDGSDLKIEYSFGEDGDFDQFAYDPFGVFSLQIVGTRAYFIMLDKQDGTRELWYYDIKADKAVNLSADMQMAVIDYLIQDDMLLLTMRSDQDIGVYRADMDMKEILKVSDTMLSDMSQPIIMRSVIYDICYETIQTEKGRERIADAIICTNLEKNETKQIYKFSGEQMPSILAVSEDFIYFKQMEPRSIGYELVRGETKVERNNVYSRIYRVDINSGKCEVIFDDLTCQVSEVYFFEKNKALIIGELCTIGEGNAGFEAKAFSVDLNDEGELVNLKVLEVRE